MGSNPTLAATKKIRMEGVPLSKEVPPLERVIVARIVKALKKYGVQWVWKTHGGPYQTSGVPDILCIAPKSGRFIGIEVKRPNGYGKATELQLAQIEKINSAGGVAGIATCEEEALELVKRAEEVLNG